MKMRDGISVSPSEVRSWERSLPVLAQDLVEAGLGEVEMLIEYRLPLTSKRADVVLAGTDRRTGGDAYVVVELKQWSRAEVWDEDERTRLFTQSTRGEFVDYLRDRFAPSPGRTAADHFLSSEVRPSKQLLKHAAKEIRDRDQFVLLDEQRLAYQIVLHAVDKARRQDLKTVVVITGGPGSGKSVIALSLLGALSGRGLSVLHATGSKSFTQTMRRHVAKGSTRTKALFTYFNNFMEADRNGLDVLICDEAHRIRKVSANRYTAARLRTGRPQVDELIDAARVPVFLLDGQQNVRPGEMGTLEQIRGHAESKGLRVQHVSLDEQFRCGGSRKYEDWVLMLLGLHESPAREWTGDDGFSVSLAESPREMEALLRSHHDQGRGARMTAGFCWRWSSPAAGAPGGEMSLVPDVRIGDWARPWNVKGDRSVGDAPPSELWATAPGGFGQVGCVYTAQGFEYDWNGVILRRDLVYRNGRLVTRRAESHDPALKPSTVTDEEADALIRNTYKVLLTRGMVGTLIYSVDAETQAFLSRLVR
ncbi:DUF2075 domain-containing protein [Actinomadura graeca]|uniref:DUF2075 domain-containing protein n=2 Tax=Actinomadura graeca TaxID=2750812 RepID=A0ABX8R7D1_9ACTN|nr:DUF2075 domain-containing protein [Actinomadura graeca]